MDPRVREGDERAIVRSLSRPAEEQHEDARSCIAKVELVDVIAQDVQDVGPRDLTLQSAQKLLPLRSVSNATIGLSSPFSLVSVATSSLHQAPIKYLYVCSELLSRPLARSCRSVLSSRGHVTLPDRFVRLVESCDSGAAPKSVGSSVLAASFFDLV